MLNKSRDCAICELKICLDESCLFAQVCKVLVMKRTVTYTQVKSLIGSTKSIRATLKGLGLQHMHKTVTRNDTPELRGMLGKAQHLVKVVEGNEC